MPNKMFKGTSEDGDEELEQDTQANDMALDGSESEELTSPESEQQASFDSDLRADWTDRRRSPTQSNVDRENSEQLSTSSHSREGDDDQRSERYQASLEEGRRGQRTSGLSTNAGILTELEWRRRNASNRTSTAQAKELEAFTRRLRTSDELGERPSRLLMERTSINNPRDGPEYHTSRIPGKSDPRPSLSHYTPVAHSTGIGERRRKSNYESESSDGSDYRRKKDHRRRRESCRDSESSDRGDHRRKIGERRRKSNYDSGSSDESDYRRKRDHRRRKESRRRHGKSGRSDRYRPKVKVDPFPKDIPSSSKLSAWEYWLTTQELASETNGVTGQRQRAIDLRLSAGDEIGRIIMLEKLMPSQEEVAPDFRFYDYLVDGVTRFFRTMSDGNINASEFQNTRQGEDENVNAYATRFKMIALKVGHVNDALATSTFIKGLKDEVARGLASSLNMSIEDTIPMVMRREANTQQSMFNLPGYQEPLKVAEVRNSSSARGRGRDRRPSGGRDKARGTKREHSRDNKSHRDQKKRQKSDSQTECFRCGRTWHRSDKCPAVDKECRGCGEKGHFEARCTKKVQEVKKHEDKVKKRSSSSSDQ
jgi:Retrotransposon gag protein